MIDACHDDEGHLWRIVIDLAQRFEMLLGVASWASQYELTQSRPKASRVSAKRGEVLLDLMDGATDGHIGLHSEASDANRLGGFFMRALMTLQAHQPSAAKDVQRVGQLITSGR
jgi:hypothetical protein